MQVAHFIRLNRRSNTVQKLLHNHQPIRIEKRGAAMRGTMDDYELHRAVNLFICAAQFVRLIDRHLRIPISVEEEQGRIIRINVENGAGEMGYCRKVVGLTTEKQVERGNPDAQTVRRGLA